MGMINWIKTAWCDWMHEGGDVKRDPYMRINWQCRTCGRWGEPVDPQTERLIVESDIREYGSK